MMDFEYYYNNVPNKGLCRNNLIYTSLISKDKKTFCQWYFNDEGYHGGHNQVVDPMLMTEKWNREVEFLTLMSNNFPDHIPKILEIDCNAKKIYLEIDGVDMWEQAGCAGKDYSSVLPDWDKQMLEIISAHKSLGFYKYSMHPSSYFIVDGKLKTINYFFCYTDKDPAFTLRSVLSHISSDRQLDLIKKMSKENIHFDSTVSYNTVQLLAFDSFRTNFLDSIMDKAKKIYA
jgi:hypothetical protein